MQNSIHFKSHNQFLLVIAIAFLFLIFYNVLLVNFYFAFNIIPSPVIFYSSVFLSIGCCTLLVTKYFFIDWKFLLAGILSAITIFFVVKNISENYYDVSWDGQAYQIEAVVKMIEGWNPLKGQLDNSVKSENIYINHYPRGVWYSSFSIYLVTDNIESGKLFNYLWFVISLCLASVALNQFFKINFFISLFIAFLASANPVLIYQSASNYIDGQIAAGILSFLILSIFIYFEGGFGSVLLLIITISLLVNYKFSMPFYLIVLSAGVILIFLVYKNRNAVRKYLMATTFGFIFGIVILGYSPYITNIIQFQNPIYPLSDKTKSEITKAIEEAIQPSSFKNMNRFERLFQSIFSKAIWSQSPLNNELKFPGTYSYQEKTNYEIADGAMAGFGPYFSLTFLICLLVFPITYFYNKKIFFLASTSIFLILLSVFISRIGWYARYAPQFYLICIIISTSLFLIKKWWVFLIGCFCLFSLFKNDDMIYRIYYTHQRKITHQVNSKLNELAMRKDFVKVYFGPFNSNRERFREEKIKFTEVKSISELMIDSPRYIPWLFNIAATN